MAAEMYLKNKTPGINGKDKDMFDFTGMFHWNPGRKMEQCLVVSSFYSAISIETPFLENINYE